MPLDLRDRLPVKMGAFLATDYDQFAYVGSSRNLHKRFQKIDFLENYEKFNIEVIWIECDRPNVIPKIEQQLLTQYNYNFLSRHSLSGSF